MSLLCFDISSSGISASLFNFELEVTRLVEGHWTVEADDEGAATLSLDAVLAQFKHVVEQLKIAGSPDPIDAICIGSFMHNCVLLDSTNTPLTPVFTWLDSRGKNGMEYVRARIGNQFHERTGCRFHPMFPVFKLAALHLSGSDLLSKAMRVVSVKSFLLHQLTGSWIEDHGMASASGLYNIMGGGWDAEILTLIGLSQKKLPPVASPMEVAGRVTPKASVSYGLPADVPVVNGTGDGFLANIGSECETRAKIAVTLGTSAVARQTLTRAVLNSSSGTFCYLADENRYLLGCAGSNGGNVLDWGRSIFGTLKDTDISVEPPIFIPLLHGERSPDWDPRLTGSWHGLMARHTAADLSRSILEGVVFNLAHFVEIVQETSGEKSSDMVLSGNGFLYPLAAPVLAAVTGMPVWMPAEPGLASLRGAAICCLRAFNMVVPQLNPRRVWALADAAIVKRYLEYKWFRTKGAGSFPSS